MSFLVNLKSKLNDLKQTGIMFAIIVALIITITPITASADSTTRDKGIAWQVGRTFENCWSWNRELSTQQIKEGSWFTRGKEVYPGHAIKSDNGKIDCTARKEIANLLDKVGISNAPELLVELGIYKFDSRSNKYKLVNDSEAGWKKSSIALRDYIAKKFEFNYSNTPPNAIKYSLLYESLKSQCLGSEIPGGVEVKVAGSNGSVTSKYYEWGKRQANDEVTVGYNLGGSSNNRLKCEQIRAEVNKTAKDYSSQNDQGIDSSSSTGSATAEETCESAGGVLSWVMCPFVEMLGGALNWVDTQVSRLLEVDEVKINDPQLYKVWSNFRNIGLILLILVMLVMVISTALGLNVLDAYTVKKAMPRMVAAIIFMLLSWWICIFMITVMNAIGQGILGIMTAPFGDKADSLSSLFSPSAGGAIVQGGALVVATGAAVLFQGSIAIIASWLGTAFLIIGIALLILVARQMFIITLILLAPIAILTWIFPGNDKGWKLWWQSFSKLLLMYPMIMALIAAGRIFAGVISFTAGESGGLEGGLITPLLKLTAYVIPYVFIPFTFKFAGGVFGNLAGIVNDRSRGAFDRLRKVRQEGTKKNIAAIGAGTRFNPNKRLGRALNEPLSTAATIASGKAGLNPVRMRANARSAEISQAALHAQEMLEKDMDVGAIKNDDDMLRAFRDDSSRADIERRLIRSGRFGAAGSRTLSNAVSAVERAQRNASPDVRQLIAGEALAATGTGFDTHADMYQAAIDASHGDASVRNALFAKMKSRSEQAGRFDLSSPGHVESMQALDDLERGASRAEINQRMRGHAMRSVGAHKLVQGKPGAVIDLATQLGQDYVAARDGGRLDLAADLAGQMTALRSASGSATPEGREAINAMLLNAGIEEGRVNGSTGMAMSVDEQLGAQINDRSVADAQYMANLEAQYRQTTGLVGPIMPGEIEAYGRQVSTQTIRTRAGAYDAGGSSRTPEQVRAQEQAQREREAT